MHNFYFGVRGNRVFLSYEYLISKQVPESTIEERFRYQKWINYTEIPSQWISTYDLPKSSDEAVVLYELQKGEKEQKSLAHISLVLDNAWSEPMRWKRYVPDYRKFCLDEDILINFCKTHALFFELLELKKVHLLKLILIVYQSFQKAVFRTKNYRSFSKKLKDAEKYGIELSLLHGFKINGRLPTKVDGFLKSRIKFFYALPLKYTRTEIMYRVNKERLLRGLSTVSYSTITRIIRDRELQNQCNPSRFGKHHADNSIYPYFNRKEPAFCDVLQIDATRSNIPYWNHASKKVAFLVLCVIMEVHSRMILAASLDYTENTNMVLDCLKKGLLRLGLTPRQIVVDNHLSYHSKLFRKFSNEAFGLGIHIRYANLNNARDKGHVERWFGIFQTRFTNHLFGSVGEGIKTSRQGGRVAPEWEKLFLKKKHLRNEETLRSLVLELIEAYNTDTRKGASPEQVLSKAKKEGLIKLTRPDIACLFYQKKVRKVEQDQLQLRHKGEDYIFKIKAENLLPHLNGAMVTIMFDPDNLTSVMIFDELGIEYLCEASQDYQINMVATPKDMAHIRKEKRQLRKRIEKSNSELRGEIKEGKKKLKQTPIISLEKPDQNKEQEEERLHDWMLNKTIGPIKKTKKKRSEKPTKDRPSIHHAKGSLKKLK